MTITTSNRIRKRYISGLIGIALFLIFGISLQTFRDLYIIESGGIFIPQNFISQSKQIYEAIITDIKFNEPKMFPCSNLEKVALSEKISQYEHINIQEAEDRLDYLWSAYYKNNSQYSCKAFPEVMEAGYKLRNAIANDPKASIDKIARELYSQNLNWNSNSYCLFGKDAKGKFLISGNSANCENSNFSDTDKGSARWVLKNGIAPLLQVAKNRLTSNSGSQDAAKNLTLTINPSLQLLSNKISDCIDANSNCPASILKEMPDIKYASFSIIDASTREIQAIGCIGSICKSKSNSDIGFLAGANIEVPPASTEKLIFSYALAMAKQVPSNQLEFQIKTSGEVDGKVSKRNEWWEKQSICDSHSSKEGCKIPLAALKFSQQIGWNQNCDNRPNNLCGISNILSPLGITNFSPISGRALVSANKHGIFIDEKKLSGPFLKWDEYDAIRQGKSKNVNYRMLESTSLLVQSIIGAGNNRVSSFGLALLSSAIYQSAKFGKITEVRLFIDPNLPSKEIPSSSPAAKIVLNGMQKVVMPAENGWVGDGTANAAFKFAFERSCDKNCPIYAKTGTVTHQDNVFGGTTLFASTVDMEELSKQINLSSNLHRNKVYSIGVIVHPNKKTKTHQASRLGMLIIKEIANQE